MGEIKYFIFAAALLFGVPAGVIIFRASDKLKRLLFALLVFSPVLDIRIKFMADESYLGDTRGLEVAFTDLLALILIIGMKFSPKYSKISLWPPNSIFYLIFLLFGAISVANAYVPLFAFFSLFRFIMVYLTLIAVYHYMRHDAKSFADLLLTVSIALIYNFTETMVQRYVMGYHRVIGVFDHPNTMVMFIELFIPMLLATMMRVKARVNLLYLIAISGGLVASVFTLSRVGMLTTAGALGLVIILSVLQKPSGRNITMTLILVAMMLGVSVKAGDTIVRRFLEAPKASGDTRDKFNDAAVAMANDHFTGVGLNNYAYALVEKQEYARYFDYKLPHAGVCHHIYRLTASETGWGGLLAFLLFIGSFYFRAFRHAISKPMEYPNALSIGIFSGFTAFHLQGFYEWAFRQMELMYPFFITCGMLLAVIALQKESLGGKKNRGKKEEALEVKNMEEWALARIMRKGKKR